MSRRIISIQVEAIRAVLEPVGLSVEFESKGSRKHPMVKVTTPAGAVHRVSIMSSPRTGENAANFARQNAKRLLCEIETRAADLALEL